MGSDSGLALSQYKAASGVLILGLVQGMAVGWASPAIAKLHRGEGPFVPTLSETATISSLFSLGLLGGFLVGAVVSSRTGRKNTLLMSPLSFTASALVAAAASTPVHLCVSRLLAGTGHGLAVGFAFLYMAEMATAAKRAELVLAITLLMPMGQFIAFAVGPAVSFCVQALLPIPFLTAIFICMFKWMPESPFYLATTGRGDELVAALRQVRAGVPEEEVRKEAAAIQRTVKQQQKDATSWRETFSTPASRKAASLVLVLCSSLAVLGITTVFAFTTQIFQESGTPLSAEVSSTLLIAVNMAMVLATMRLIQHMGRVTLLCMSALGNAAAFTTLSGFFFARDVLGADVSGVLWVPLVSLVVFTASNGLGIIAIPGMLMSELLGQRAKAVLGPGTGVLVALSAFVINKNFLLVGKTLGFWLPFAFFAVTNLVYGVFVFAFVPETKGKTLAEVQDMLRGDSGTTKTKKKQ